METIEDAFYTFRATILWMPFCTIPSPTLPISVAVHLIETKHNALFYPQTYDSNSVSLVLLDSSLLLVPSPSFLAHKTQYAFTIKKGSYLVDTEIYKLFTKQYQVMVI